MATYVVDNENKTKKTIPNPQRQKNEHHLYVLYKNKTWNEIHIT